MGGMFSMSRSDYFSTLSPDSDHAQQHRQNDHAPLRQCRDVVVVVHDNDCDLEGRGVIGDCWIGLVGGCRRGNRRCSERGVPGKLNRERHRSAASQGPGNTGDGVCGGGACGGTRHIARTGGQSDRCLGVGRGLRARIDDGDGIVR